MVCILHLSKLSCEENCGIQLREDYHLRASRITLPLYGKNYHMDYKLICDFLVPKFITQIGCKRNCWFPPESASHGHLSLYHHNGPNGNKKSNYVAHYREVITEQKSLVNVLLRRYGSKDVILGTASKLCSLLFWRGRHRCTWSGLGPLPFSSTYSSE